MGASWRDRSEAAAAVFQKADQLLRDHFPRPLSEYIFADVDAATLARTDVAQPAIFVTSMACWAGLNDLAIIQADDLSVTAGLSLGEYTALAIAGAISFEDALRLVTLRGRAMQDAADTSDGGMVALIGADEPTAYEVVEATKQSDILVAANFNAPGQVVLSGASAAIDRAATFASEEKAPRCQTGCSRCFSFAAHGAGSREVSRCARVDYN
ncbi:Acyl transferase [Gracilaria domingensis]|nr:Acyl transferase [Gracilaria domingensis]